MFAQRMSRVFFARLARAYGSAIVGLVTGVAIRSGTSCAIDVSSS